MKLDSKGLKKFLKKAGDTLEGEWLLVGGTLLPAVGIDVRATVDIDIVGLGESENAQSLELMKVAEALGLSVDSINQAASFFVSKVGYKEKDLFPLFEGKKATIYRPSCELYWRLKVNRLSESDTTDCQHYLAYCRGQGDPISMASLKKILNSKKEETSEKDRVTRIDLLLGLL